MQPASSMATCLPACMLKVAPARIVHGDPGPHNVLLTLLPPGQDLGDVHVLLGWTHGQGASATGTLATLRLWARVADVALATHLAASQAHASGADAWRLRYMAPELSWRRSVRGAAPLHPTSTHVERLRWRCWRMHGEQEAEPMHPGGTHGVREQAQRSNAAAQQVLDPAADGSDHQAAANSSC